MSVNKKVLMHLLTLSDIDYVNFANQNTDQDCLGTIKSNETFKNLVDMIVDDEIAEHLLMKLSVELRNDCVELLKEYDRLCDGDNQIFRYKMIPLKDKE